MQLMPQIIRKLKINDSFDIIENIDGGARKFQECMNTFPNNLEYAIASYNGGIQPITTQISEGRGLLDVNEETRSYVFLVLKYYSKFRLENNLK
jgi:soluble lytic murein transglycosylase-like protein